MDAHRVNFQELSDFDKGWLVGIIEGEGAVAPRGRGKRRASVKLVMCDKDVIDRYRQLLNIKKESCKRTNRRLTVKGKPYSPSYESYVCGDNARLLMLDIFPHMSERKQQQIQEYFLDYGGQTMEEIRERNGKVAGGNEVLGELRRVSGL